MVRNSGINAVGTAVAMLFNFIAVFVLARRLGDSVFGLYFTVFAITLVVYFVLESGITTVLTRRIAREPHLLKQFVSEGMGLLAVICLLAVVMMTCIGAAWAGWQAWRGTSTGVESLTGTALIPIFAIAGVACAARLVLEFLAAAFRGLELMEYENIGRVIQAVVFALLVLTSVRGPAETAVYRAVWILVVTHVIGAAYMAVALQRGWHCLGLTVNGRVMRDWLPESLPLGIGDLVQRVAWQIDTILLGWLQPLSQVGLYSIAYRPLQPLNLVPRTVLSVTFPLFSRLAELDRRSLGRVFVKSIRLLWIVSLPVSIGICVAARPIIVIPAGEKFADAVQPMRVLIWIVNLSFISTQFRFLFTALGKQVIFTRLVVPMLIGKTLLELALIPMFGLWGACAGSLVAEAAFLAAGLVVCHRLGLGRLEWGRMALAIPPAAIMAAVLWPLRDIHWALLIPTIGVATLAFFVLCVVFGAIERDERMRFLATCKQLWWPQGATD